jgi:glycosidase
MSKQHVYNITSMVNILILCLMMLSASCQKEPQKNISDTTLNTEPIQYGTPFTGVPDPRDATIYQVNIRSFSPQRNFKGVIARLDSIKSLGVNVIYLMPIHPVGVLKGINSPYAVRDHMAVNPEFGTLEDLRKLVEEAHHRDMAVIFDWVANHTAWDHVWMAHTQWYEKDSGGNIVSPNTWYDVAQLNFNNSEMRAAMIKAMKYWVLVANIDGYRCDYSDGPPQDFWRQAIDTLRNMKSHKLLLLAEGTRIESFSSGFNYTFGFRFYDQLKEIFRNNKPATSLSNVNTTEYTAAGPSHMVVRYTTNHDVNSSDGTPLDLFGGKPGSMAAFVIAAYMRGVPMIYNGQEVGNSFRLTFPFTGSTIDWSKNADMVAEYKRLIALRNASDALRRGTFTAYSTSDVAAFTRTLGDETILVIANVRNATTSYTLPEALAGEWKDAFSGNAFSTENLTSLPAYRYLVLRKSI